MSAIVDSEKIPPNWPTHRMSDEFLLELGRCIATFGALEEVLLKTVYAISGTKKHEQITDEMYQKWRKSIGDARTDALKRLINKLENTLRQADEPAYSNWPKLIADLRALNTTRDVLCHGSWHSGVTERRWRPLFVDAGGERFEGEFGCNELKKFKH